MAKTKRRRSLFFDDEIWEELQLRAGEMDTTVSELIRRAVARKLANLRRKEATS